QSEFGVRGGGAFLLSHFITTPGIPALYQDATLDLPPAIACHAKLKIMTVQKKVAFPPLGSAGGQVSDGGQSFLSRGKACSILASGGVSLISHLRRSYDYVYRRPHRTKISMQGHSQRPAAKNSLRRLCF
ncbi:MAG TPA: hypothetical protein VFI62_14915, partial [Burkholderiales bacterium]|nr:hypothetical protein [Burkholderiales bacterium]